MILKSEVGRMFPPMLKQKEGDTTPLYHLSATWCRTQVEQQTLHLLGFKIRWRDFRKMAEYVSRTLSLKQTERIVWSYMEKLSSPNGVREPWSHVMEAFSTAVVSVASDAMSVTGMGHSVKVATHHYELSTQSLRNVAPHVIQRGLVSHLWWIANLDQLLDVELQDKRLSVGGAPPPPLRTKLTPEELKRLFGKEDLMPLPFQQETIDNLAKHTQDIALLGRAGNGKSFPPMAMAILNPRMLTLWIVPFTTVLQDTYDKCERRDIRVCKSDELSGKDETRYIREFRAASIVVATPEACKNPTMLMAIREAIENGQICFIFLDDIHEILEDWRNGYNALSGPLIRVLQIVNAAPGHRIPSVVFSTGTVSPSECKEMLQRLGRFPGMVKIIRGEVFCPGIALYGNLLEGPNANRGGADNENETVTVGLQSVVAHLKNVKAAGELKQFGVLVFVREKAVTLQYSELAKLLDADDELNGSCEVRRFHAGEKETAGHALPDGFVSSPTRWMGEKDFDCRIIMCTIILGVGVDVATIRSVFVLGDVYPRLSNMIQLFSRCARTHNSRGTAHLLMAPWELRRCDESITKFLRPVCRRKSIHIHLTGNDSSPCGPGDNPCDICLKDRAAMLALPAPPGPPAPPALPVGPPRPVAPLVAIGAVNAEADVDMNIEMDAGFLDDVVLAMDDGADVPVQPSPESRVAMIQAASMDPASASHHSILQASAPPLAVPRRSAEARAGGVMPPSLPSEPPASPSLLSQPVRAAASSPSTPYSSATRATVTGPPPVPALAAANHLQKRMREGDGMTESIGVIVSSAAEGPDGSKNCPVCYMHTLMNGGDLVAHPPRSCPLLRQRCIRCQSKQENGKCSFLACAKKAKMKVGGIQCSSVLFNVVRRLTTNAPSNFRRTLCSSCTSAICVCCRSRTTCCTLVKLHVNQVDSVCMVTFAYRRPSRMLDFRRATIRT